MLNREMGLVTGIISERPSVQELHVQIGRVKCRATNYIELCGPAQVGDKILVNTTAVFLRLGTGGVHFVICNLNHPAMDDYESPGHIMKLRYTPMQMSVLSVEEDDSPHQDLIDEFTSLGGMPVVCCELHSQIAPVAASVKALSPEAKIAYIMTDGAALPLAFSRLVAEMQEKGLLDGTITCGQAFGGDLEAVSVHTALIAAREVLRADAAIVCQGPGNAGTGTKYGFSGIQQGEALNAVGTLGGTPIAVLRMSFADRRERHRGISHHSLTVLGRIALVRCLIPVPVLPDDREQTINQQMSDLLAHTNHDPHTLDGRPGLAELSRLSLDVRTMGRTIPQDREFFLAASAGGVLACRVLVGGER